MYIRCSAGSPTSYSGKEFTVAEELILRPVSDDHERARTLVLRLGRDSCTPSRAPFALDDVEGRLERAFDEVTRESRVGAVVEFDLPDRVLG